MPVSKELNNCQPLPIKKANFILNTHYPVLHIPSGSKKIIKDNFAIK
jgi:hypothetical protein